MIYSDIALGDNWDIQLSSNGDFLIHKDANALAQTIAVECRTALRDKYFDADTGIDYQSILGSPSGIEILTREIRDIVEQIDGVQDVLFVQLTNFVVETRTVEGLIIVTMENGESIEVTL